MRGAIVAEWACLLSLASLLCLPTPTCSVGTRDEVQSLSGGGVERKAGADLWTHTDGPPRRVKVGLDLPEGENEEVQRIVAAKKIDIAAAGLHQAVVMEKNALEKKERSDEEDETDVTKAKIADVKVARIRKAMKATDEDISKYKKQVGDLGVKQEEDKAAVEMASAKKKKDLQAKLNLVEAQYKNAGVKLEDSQQTLQKLAMDVVGAKEESNTAHALHEQTRLDNVALRVNLQAAKDKVEHAKFMGVKSKNLKKLADAKLAKENLKKAAHHAKNDVKSAQEMLAIMNSGPGQKEAKKSVDKAKKRLVDTKKKWVEATKKLDKVKNEVNDNETKWAKKIAYRRVMKSAKVGAEAHQAEKAFENALTDADKKSKKAALQQMQKEMAGAEKRADKATNQAMHVAFEAKQDKKWRADKFKEEKKKMEEEAKKKAANKEDQDMAKAALSDTGKPPAAEDLLDIR